MHPTASAKPASTTHAVLTSPPPPLPPSFPHTPSPYYREPVKCAPHGVPVHLVEPLVRSFGEDHFVADEGDVVFYQKDPKGV